MNFEQNEIIEKLQFKHGMKLMLSELHSSPFTM